MANKLLMWTETMKKFIYDASKERPYAYMRTLRPRRVGDIAELVTDDCEVIRVMLCSVKGAGKRPTFWMVEVPRGR